MFSRALLYAKTCRAYTAIDKLNSCFIKQQNINRLLSLLRVSSKQIQYDQQKTYNQSENKYSIYMKNVFFSVTISAGVYFILSLRNKELSKPSSWIPSVFAASPIHNPSFDNYFTKEEINRNDNEKSRKCIRKTYNFIADAVQKVTDGVVFIAVKDHIRKDVAGKALTVSNGSGFIIESDGLIMTNAHVVGNKPRASSIVVKLSDGREFDGVIEELDAMSDLALVRINCKNLHSVSLGSSTELRLGEFVVVVGSPLSLSNSVTSGIVSSVGRNSQELGIGSPEMKYIQTDAAITFGNSGGPLINLDGEVIGINSIQFTYGISFAIPIDYAKKFLKKATDKRSFMSKRKSEVVTTNRRRYLGIAMFDIPPEDILQRQQKVDTGQKAISITHGIKVNRVNPGSPAYYAGLTEGDIITHINGKEIHSCVQCYTILESHGDLNMVVVRDGQRYSVAVAPEE